MTDPVDKTPELHHPAIDSGAALFALGGLAAAFGLALSTAWLGGVALMAAPHRGPLLVVGALCLSGGAILLWRQQRTAATCGSNGVCTRPAVRALTLVGLLIGAALLWAGYTYA
jgi:mercuric ion transport protein